LNQPPSNISFTVILALTCTLIGLPLQLSVSFVLDEFCRKRPILEQIGLSTVYWFGHGINTSEGIDFHDDRISILQKNFEEAEAYYSTNPSTLPALKKTPSQKMMMVSPSSSFTPSAAVAAAATGLKRIPQIATREAEMALYNTLTVREEMEDICSNVQKHYYKNNFITTNLTKLQLDAWNEAYSAKSKAIYKYFGILPDGSFRTLPFFEHVFYQNSRHKLEKQLINARLISEDIQYELEELSTVSSQLKEVVLLHHFILEQFTPLKRWILENQLLCFQGFVPSKIDAIPWLTAWMFVILLFAFYFYWILTWGLQNGKLLLFNWGLNFAIDTIQDIFWIQIVKVIVLYLVAILSIKPQLIEIRYQLHAISLSYLQGFIPLRKYITTSTRDFFTVIQHLSPACRVSWKNTFDNLVMSKMLRSIDDYDMLSFRKNYDRQLAILMLLLIGAVPLVIFFFGSFAAEVVLETVLPILSSGFLVANYYLYTLSISALIAPYVIIIGFILWYLLFYRRTKLFIKRKQISLRNVIFEQSIKLRRSLEKHRNPSFLKEIIKGMGESCSSFVLWIATMSNPYLALLESKELAVSHQNTWCFMNFPYKLQPIRILPRSSSSPRSRYPSSFSASRSFYPNASISASRSFYPSASASPSHDDRGSRRSQRVDSYASSMDLTEGRRRGNDSTSPDALSSDDSKLYEKIHRLVSEEFHSKFDRRYATAASESTDLDDEGERNDPPLTSAESSPFVEESPYSDEYEEVLENEEGFSYDDFDENPSPNGRRTGRNVTAVEGIPDPIKALRSNNIARIIKYEKEILSKAEKIEKTAKTRQQQQQQQQQRAFPLKKNKSKKEKEEERTAESETVAHFLDEKTYNANYQKIISNLSKESDYLTILLNKEMLNASPSKVKEIMKKKMQAQKRKQQQQQGTNKPDTTAAGNRIAPGYYPSKRQQAEATLYEEPKFSRHSRRNASIATLFTGKYTVLYDIPNAILHMITTYLQTVLPSRSGDYELLATTMILNGSHFPILISDIFLLLTEIWKVYYPFGESLSKEEIKEILSEFQQFLIKINFHEEVVMEFSIFQEWFENYMMKVIKFHYEMNKELLSAITRRQKREQSLPQPSSLPKQVSPVSSPSPVSPSSPSSGSRSPPNAVYTKSKLTLMIEDLMEKRTNTSPRTPKISTPASPLLTNEASNRPDSSPSRPSAQQRPPSPSKPSASYTVSPRSSGVVKEMTMRMENQQKSFLLKENSLKLSSMKDKEELLGKDVMKKMSSAAVGKGKRLIDGNSKSFYQQPSQPKEYDLDISLLSENYRSAIIPRAMSNLNEILHKLSYDSLENDNTSEGSSLEGLAPDVLLANLHTAVNERMLKSASFGEDDRNGIQFERKEEEGKSDGVSSFNNHSNTLVTEAEINDSPLNRFRERSLFFFSASTPKAVSFLPNRPPAIIIDSSYNPSANQKKPAKFKDSGVEINL
jgi:hypothetical protein